MLSPVDAGENIVNGIFVISGMSHWLTNLRGGFKWGCYEFIWKW